MSNVIYIEDWLRKKEPETITISYSGTYQDFLEYIGWHTISDPSKWEVDENGDWKRWDW